MGKNKIYEICEKVLQVTDEEIKEIRDIAEGQRLYLHPLKLATQHWQHQLGEHNDRVLDALINLKTELEKGADIKKP